jgi:hypothetical protein
MKKLRNKFIKNLRYLFLIGVSALGLMAIIGTGGGGGGDGDPCAGPVPCLTTDWGDTSRVFIDSDGSPILVLSDGTVFAAAGVNDDGHLISLGGTVTDCYNGVISLAIIDLNDDGIPQDSEVFDASGNAKICGSTLTGTNLVIDGVPENDVVATYSGTASVHIASEVPPEFLFETMDKLNSE